MMLYSRKDEDVAGLAEGVWQHGDALEWIAATPFLLLQPYNSE